ncbi:hypothetical protein SynBIOSE41_03718 [Synechococcus sp. BIOS-E4-1]|nr:hypothetical protein SynBIOSE41_03718 [Synechococcus sp. BIOS-E4-1]
MPLHKDMNLVPAHRAALINEQDLGQRCVFCRLHQHMD